MLVFFSFLYNWSVKNTKKTEEEDDEMKNDADNIFESICSILLLIFTSVRAHSSRTIMDEYSHRGWLTIVALASKGLNSPWQVVIKRQVNLSVNYYSVPGLSNQHPGLSRSRSCGVQLNCVPLLPPWPASFLFVVRCARKHRKTQSRPRTARAKGTEHR